ncbi:MAG: ComEA family DNA-binding protein [Cyanobacteria bacterium P01_A01_bin.123]
MFSKGQYSGRSLRGETLAPWGRWSKHLRDRVSPRRRQLLANPYARFESAEDVTIAAEAGITIDANRATVDDWLRLPGLSIHQARSLVELSQSGLQFYCLEDLAAALSLPLQALRLWEPVLRFYHYDAQSCVQPVLINPNHATVEQLSQIPGIDLYLARQIVQQRQAFGPYQSFAHFHQRLRLPATLASQLMYALRF